MPRLILVRHAKSAWDDPALADFDRPLAPRGRAAAKWIGEALTKHHLVADRVLCSPARRTRETLELAATSNARFAGEVRYPQELYSLRDDDYVDFIGRAGEGAQVLMIVGHNPAVADTAIALSREGDAIDPEDGFPTGAIAVLDFDTGDWRKLPGAGRLIAFLRPPKKS